MRFVARIYADSVSSDQCEPTQNVVRAKYSLIQIWSTTSPVLKREVRQSKVAVRAAMFLQGVVY